VSECEYCFTKIEDDEECPACAEWFHQEMRRMHGGDWRAALKPAGPWRSREDTMRAQDAEEDHRAGWGFHPETDSIARWFLRGAD
jgi:hypothetical protein